MKQASRYAQIGQEYGQAGQREAFRSAVLGARGRVGQAGAALGVSFRKMAREARRLGIDWEALLVEARALPPDAESDPASSISS